MNTRLLEQLPEEEILRLCIQEDLNWRQRSVLLRLRLMMLLVISAMVLSATAERGSLLHITSLISVPLLVFLYGLMAVIWNEQRAALKRRIARSLMRTGQIWLEC